jgi:hypothetical protein
MKTGTLENKKLILCLRWTVIILISFLIIFGEGSRQDLNLPNLFILFYILSNVILTFSPRVWFFNPKFFYTLVILDTGIISLGMFLSGRAATDFFLAWIPMLVF